MQLLEKDFRIEKRTDGSFSIFDRITGHTFDFEILESNLWKCLECETTFENENEAKHHVRETITIYDEEDKKENERIETL